LRGIGPNGRPLGGRFLPQGPLWRKRAGRRERAQNRQKSGACCWQTPSNAANPPDRSGSRSSVASLRRRRIMASRWLAAAVRVIAARGGEIHYVRTVTLRVAWCTARSRHIRRTDDEGRSRQATGKDRRGREGFTTRPAKAGAARKSQAAEVAGPRAQRSRGIFRKRRCLPR